MTQRDHRDDPEATASPQALVRDLRAQAEALPRPSVSSSWPQGPP
jgi:hypothetical protein